MPVTFIEGSLVHESDIFAIAKNLTTTYATASMYDEDAKIYHVKYHNIICTICFSHMVDLVNNFFTGNIFTPSLTSFIIQYVKFSSNDTKLKFITVDYDKYVQPNATYNEQAVGIIGVELFTYDENIETYEDRVQRCVHSGRKWCDVDVHKLLFRDNREIKIYSYDPSQEN